MSGMDFYETNDPTNSVKALKEDVQGLGCNPTRSTPQCYNNTTHMQYDKITQKKQKHKHNESRHSEMGPVRQNPIQRTVKNCSSKGPYTLTSFLIPVAGASQLAPVNWHVCHATGTSRF